MDKKTMITAAMAILLDRGVGEQIGEEAVMDKKTMITAGLAILLDRGVGD